MRSTLQSIFNAIKSRVIHAVFYISNNFQFRNCTLKLKASLCSNDNNMRHIHTKAGKKKLLVGNFYMPAKFHENIKAIQTCAFWMVIGDSASKKAKNESTIHFVFFYFLFLRLSYLNYAFKSEFKFEMCTFDKCIMLKCMLHIDGKYDCPFYLLNQVLCAINLRHDNLTISEW